ncbi:unnamed protein product [Amoebophrya sp. A120]|nr:unnamed protein product [Amoebophrya sp. A120]|eukprot:GSA120T00006523001.1
MLSTSKVSGLVSPAALVACFWLITTAFYSNPSNTIFLRELHSGVAHNLTRFVGSSCICLLMWAFSTKPTIAVQHLGAFLFPAACMVVMNVSNSVALINVGVTLTYVIKATIPVWTCLYCFLVRKERFSPSVICALLLCCIGVGLASFGEVRFSWLGFFAALLSCVATTAFNLSSKALMQKFAQPPFRAFGTCLVNASVLASTVYVANIEGALALKSFPVYQTTLDQTLSAEPVAWKSYFNDGTTAAKKCLSSLPQELLTKYWLLVVLFITCTSYFAEYGANFVYAELVTPVTFAITDIVRRIFTIVVNAAMYGYPVSWLNFSGILTSLCGALAYALLTASKGGSKTAGKEKGSARAASVKGGIPLGHLAALAEKNADSSSVSTASTASSSTTANKLKKPTPTETAKPRRRSRTPATGSSSSKR